MSISIYIKYQPIFSYFVHLNKCKHEKTHPICIQRTYAITELTYPCTTHESQLTQEQTFALYIDTTHLYTVGGITHLFVEKHSTLFHISHYCIAACWQCLLHCHVVVKSGKKRVHVVTIYQLVKLNATQFNLQLCL